MMTEPGKKLALIDGDDEKTRKYGPNIVFVLQRATKARV